jgi:hypothetical protein
LLDLVSCAAYCKDQDGLALMQVPMVVSDFCEEAVLRAHSVVQRLSLKASHPEMNPFRSPLRLPQENNLLHCYPHAFMFVVM